ncbi:isocitrate lyase/PEP mutase family protein [Roseococcus suduntuyensis]|uniref:2-methylisocitrate lyase-like PEP mutase family enzyme n=1 Tax=Roseococcus suduntuyensis TaxID=455361 RepID=A0A840AHY8_9PROT|nr:oxaloacetate decarboxylase [Roseococcus suduntuyensis]MBB3900166.1 2-methylisocitrate lyase-like PEP mutase family enzyme [Roseococcus suduntuyensis]
MTASPGARLRARLAQGLPTVAPGAYDGLSARLVAEAGFTALYASGGAIARSLGVPDLGLLGMEQVVERVAAMCDAVDIPVIADADTGYGNALNTQRAVQAFERAGVAAIHLEDQQFPKRCGHYEDKSLVSIAEMAGKLRAARDAARDPDFVLIARTDAIAVEGLDGALARAHAYREAGADVIFVEAPTSLAQIERIAREVPGPKLMNMFHGGKTPIMPAEELARMGYGIVIIPSDLQRAAIHAMRATLAAIAQDGTSMAMAERMVSFTERERIIGTHHWLERDARYGA